MRDNPERGELDPVDDVCRRCKKNSPSVLSCIGKKTKEGCDCISEVGTVHSGRDGEGPVSPRKPRESGRRESFKNEPKAIKGARSKFPFRNLEPGLNEKGVTVKTS